MADEPTNWYRELVLKSQIEAEKKDQDLAAGAERLQRRMDRIRRWAIKQDKDELAWLLALEVVREREGRRIMRIQKEAVDLVRDTKGLIDDRQATMDALVGDLTRHLNSYRQARKRGAASRHANDPKQAAKREAHSLWQEWQSGKFPRIRTVEQFATEAMRRWPILTSANVIRRWSSEWSKEMREQRS